MEKIKKQIDIYWEKYKEVIKYLFFGVLTTVVNFIVYYLLIWIIGTEEGIAGLASNIIATIVAILFAYVTNKLFVFESKTNNRKELITEMISFFACRVFSLLVDNGIYFIGCTWLKFPSFIVKTITQVIVVVLNYVFSKLIIFKNNKAEKKIENKKVEE